jgi:hypothetical protein
VNQNTNVAAEFHFARPATEVIPFVILAGLAVGVWLAMESVWPAIPTLVLGLWFSVGTVTQINASDGSVVQVKRLLTVLPISSTGSRLSDFVAVQVYLRPATLDDSDSDGQWNVGLKRVSGKVLAVMWFSEIRRQEPSEEVEGRIQELARVTRLPIERVGET